MRPALDVAVVSIGGERVMFLLPTIRDEYPPELKDALAIRREATIRGRCPRCGATWTLPNRAERRRAVRERRILHTLMEHEPGCSATTEHIVALVRQHRGGDEP